MPAPRSHDSVFLLGCGRSGTTLAYDVLAAHETFSWISNWTDRSGRAELAAFNGMFRKSRRGELAYRRGMPRPSEGYRLWNRALGVRLDTGVLAEADVTSQRTARSRALADAHRRFGRGEIFLNKNTRNARMLGLFAEMFPDALFVHVLRSPLDAISSLVEVAWWKDLPLWTQGGETPRLLAADHEREVELAAELWCKETVAARDAGRRHEDRYLEIRYEDLLADPRAVSHRLLEAMDVSPSDGFVKALDRLQVRHRVDTHRDRLTPREQDLGWDMVRDVAGEFSYGRTVGTFGAE